MQTQPIRQMVQQALQNDRQIDKSELKTIQEAMLADQQVTPDELAPLVDALTQNQIAQGAVVEAIQFLAQHTSESEADEKLAAPEKSAESEKPAAQTPAEGSAAPAATDAAKSAPAKHWKLNHAIQGSFNHTSVSAGWEGQYGSEKTATRLEGSYQLDARYEKGNTSWNNRVLVEYGNTFVKGQDNGRAVSRNNLEMTSEAAHKLDERGAFKIEIPYASLYTKGPLTEIDGRKFRETTGAKVTYQPNPDTKYSVKVGAGFQQTHDPNTRRWNNEVGVEMVVEGQQTLGFMKAPIISATGAKEGNVAFLDRLEANVQVNAFNPLQNGAAISNTDIGIRVGTRYYLNEQKNIWMGVGKQWEYGGKPDSTWESKFTADAGLKF